ncbi:cystathionine beta-lyase [Raphidocelis subcapitata]|uniref:cysteine-S-conjugate beta-lyase n=1 Tax=Raphidocelis subcapitata TaxID=307507 RepID=A0A2V0NST1_9CHLO|nr:cystathionine beta-lyase [Raphidocelis subcapitata]|eukprot:GBF88630.1 cystathionine beta-lyase [Raphidocelis subcapitata]
MNDRDSTGCEEPAAAALRPPRRHGLGTTAVHAATAPGRVQGACVTPIFQAATFAFEGTEDGYHAVRYTRCNNNPTQLALAAQLAALEGAEAALPLASGMAAISSTLLHLLEPGAHVLVPSSTYGGTHDLLASLLRRWGVSASAVGPDSGPREWEAMLQPGKTRVFYVEALSNPLVQIMDLRAVVAFARRHGLVSIIDATFTTPLNLRPLELGFDVVLHSATKYLSGHSDVIAGVVAGSSELVEGVKATANLLGPSIDPHAAFLVSRGLRTLALRVVRQNSNALELARFLARSPKVLRVHHPGLEASPYHQRAQALFANGGCGGVFSFELADGVDAAETLLKGLRLALVAPSLGGVETLVTRPATTSHAGLSPSEREAAGISDGLIRVAVGIEDTADLLADFGTALAGV